MLAKSTKAIGISIGIMLGSITVSSADTTNLQQYKRPLSIPFSGTTKYSFQLATLGKMLFYDPRLSGAKNMSCANCHNPSFGYEMPVDLAIGAANTPLDRHIPTILNMAWVSPNFWDGRAATLEEQAAGPITSEIEMNGKFEVIVKDLKQVPDYVNWFAQVFPDETITRENILKAIATFERTIISGWSPFDRWVEGDPQAVSAGAKHGFELFVGKAKCASCHSGWNFTDNKFHDIGLDTTDIGRAKIEPHNPKALHAFKTPGLRNTIYRAPYMHNGSVNTLSEVISHYEQGGTARPSLSKKMEPFSLTTQEHDDLIAFLETLTAENQEASIPILPN